MEKRGRGRREEERKKRREKRGREGRREEEGGERKEGKGRGEELTLPYASPTIAISLTMGREPVAPRTAS